MLSWGGMLFFFAAGLFYCFAERCHITLLLAYYFSMTFVAVLFFVLPRYQIILTYGIIPVSALGATRLYEKINLFKKYTLK